MSTEFEYLDIEQYAILMVLSFGTLSFGKFLYFGTLYSWLLSVLFQL